jgi:hypothetical protein
MAIITNHKHQKMHPYLRANHTFGCPYVMMKTYSFEKLDVWQDARLLANLIYKKLPDGRTTWSHQSNAPMLRSRSLKHSRRICKNSFKRKTTLSNHRLL